MSQPSIQLPGTGREVRLAQDDYGVPTITAADFNDACFALGWCHARDRGLQMLLVRILGQGRGSELLRASQELLEIDLFARRLNFTGDTDAELTALSPRARAAADAYCRGINQRFATGRIPWELRLLGCPWEPWTIPDSLLTAKIVSYVGLAQSQADIERFLVECVQSGISREQLEEFFPGQLAGLDLALLKQIRLGQRCVPEVIRWASALPRGGASNNWAVGRSRSRSGKPMFCNDPHLEISRLPAIWYEAVLRWQGPAGPRYAMGATIPGVPGVVAGRTNNLAWGVTYAFMDCVDSWIEDCRAGSCRRGDAWAPFTARREIIRRKRRPPVEATFHENEHGVLDGDPHTPGLYLATRWSGADGAGASSLDAACEILEAHSVEEGQRILGNLNNGAWNWVLADRSGGIAYQMAGRMPRRQHGVSGLVPLPGWVPANDWQGFVPPEDLPRQLNPAEGFIVTANDDLNHLGRVRPGNAGMPPYRADRIRDVLREGHSLTIDDMKRLQFDLHSLQAERFMEILRPLLPEFAGLFPETVRLLAAWDCVYANDSRAAFVFEQVYSAWLQEVFGRVLGRDVFTQLQNRTSLFVMFFAHFDRILLAESSAWFGGRSREDIGRAALGLALAVRPEPYGTGRTLRMNHLLFDGRLPRWLGFDRTILQPGGRATVHQAQTSHWSGHTCGSGPSLRLVTDLATDELHSVIPGGASDRPFTRHYADQLRDWATGRYKVLRGL